MGLGPLALSYFGLRDPCTQSVNLSQIGPGTQSYTTAPFTTPTTLSGPIGATLYATSTTTDTEWVVQLSDMAPDKRHRSDLRRPGGQPARPGSTSLTCGSEGHSPSEATGGT